MRNNGSNCHSFVYRSISVKYGAPLLGGAGGGFCNRLIININFQPLIRVDNQLSPGIRKFNLLVKVFIFVNRNKSKTAFGILIK
jgi:hypothetical protein